MRNERPSLTRLDRVEPEPLLRELMQRGEADPATVTLLRLQWLRREQPAARVETAVVPIDDRLVAVHARIGTPDGWSVSAHAAVELPDNPGTALEQAETRALSRALDLAGYALTELPAVVDEVADVVADTAPAPPARRTRREQAAPAEATASSETAEPGQPAAPGEPAVPEPMARAVNRPAMVNALRKMPGRDETRPGPAVEETPPARPQRGDFTVVHDRRSHGAQPAPATDDDGDENQTPVEDYSWTAFWRWAKAQGLRDQEAIAEVIGRPVGRMNPGEIRAALREHGVEG